MSGQTQTMQAHWREYRDRVYPQGTGPEQNKQLHRAFFAGCLCLKEEFEKLATLPGDAAVVELEKLYREVVEIAGAHAQNCEARN
jgi:hypothetical protein